jgi:hypothetical protein
VATVDDWLPFIANIAVANAASLAGLLAVTTAACPPLLPALLPLAWAYRQLQLYYRDSSREVLRSRRHTRHTTHTRHIHTRHTNTHTAHTHTRHTHTHTHTHGTRHTRHAVHV